MDLVLFSAIPRAALFFLLLVAAAISAEVIYLVKRKLNSSEVTLPKSLQTPSSLPPQPAMMAVTTEIVSETPKKGRLTRKTTMIILSTLLIALTIPIGLALVKQRQGVEKQAAGCTQKWPADPGTDCGRSTQSPAQGATGVSLTPNFHWDYGGYPSGSCGGTSGCSTYYANVYLWRGNCSSGTEGCGDGNLVASCNLGTRSGASYQDAPFSCFKQWRDGPFLQNLEPNTIYTWRPASGADGIVHAEQSWNYTFTTGAAATPTPTPPAFTIQCQGAAAFDSNWAPIANLNTIAVGQIVYFTVNGQTNEPGGLTKARFTINGGTPVETTTKHGTDFYIQYTVATAGPYTVQGEVFNPALGWK